MFVTQGKHQLEGLKKPIEKVETLHKKIDLLPTSKTVNVVINETTRQRTEVYGTATVSGRSGLVRSVTEDGTMTIDSGLYNLTALNTGFNPSDEVARYAQNERTQSGVQTISTKGIEEKLDKLLKSFENFESLQIFLDKYTLIGELAPGLSRRISERSENALIMDDVIS